MSSVSEKFLRYVSYDTQSKDEQEQIPSTEKQRALAQLLADELNAMGASEVRVSPFSYVYAVIPATSDKKIPALGFISHMDTSPDASGTNVRPRIIENYGGEDICLNEEKKIFLTPKESPNLLRYIGQDLIVTDGTTLLGADNKAGVAEIMSMAEYLLAHPEIPHGKICIGFTPDEEVGRGADLFDVDGFGAEVAYTVDGGALAKVEYENFNAAAGRVIVHGRGVHPGNAKNAMKNAILMAMEFHRMLPAEQNPMYTEGYEGFYHLGEIQGDMVQTQMDYIIRDHDREKFEAKKKLFLEAADFLNAKYGAGTVTATVKDSYYNMKEKIEPYMYLIDIAMKAMEECGETPAIIPIRGGTDGARLSYMGLPCPNLSSGAENSHGVHEFASVQSLEKITEILIQIVKNFESRE